MDDTAKNVALVAQAIKGVFEANPLVRDDLEYDPGIWEEAARQAIAAYLNAWREKYRVTEPVFDYSARQSDAGSASPEPR